MKALRQFCIVFSICSPLAGCALDVSGWGRRHTEWAVSVAKNRNSFGGTSEWKVINTSNIPVYQILLGDFDGDGKADVFTTWDGKWRISVANDSNSLGGTSNWKVINTSDVLLSDIRLSDFDGDGKADVFTALDGKWLVSLGGTSKWKAINTSWVYPPEYGWAISTAMGRRTCSQPGAANGASQSLMTKILSAGPAIGR
jgi:hypothetical protein